MILRIKFTKESYLKYISHLDMMRLFQRAFRMADIPIKYSEGFNPHPKFSIGSALSLGISSEGEYMDLDMEEEIPVQIFINRMNDVLPNNIKILKGEYIEDEKSISSMISWGYYNITFQLKEKLNDEEIRKEIRKFLSYDEIMIKKEKRKKKKVYEKVENIRQQIGNINLKDFKYDKIEIDTLLKTGDNGNLKPVNFLNALQDYTSIVIMMDTVNIHRLELYIEQNGEIVKPL